MRIILFFIANCFALAVTAQQLEDLLQNQNITWVAEGYQDIITEAITNKNDTMNYIIPLKFISNQEDKEGEDFGDRPFSYLLINAINEGKTPIYKDEKCNIQIDKSTIINCDTVIICFPSDDYKGTGREIICTYPDPNQILFYRLYQTYYYDSLNVKFVIKNNAMALMTYDDDIGISTGPLCWVKISDLTKPHHLENKNITWAAKIIGRNSKINLIGQKKNVKGIKITETQPMQQYFSDLKRKVTIPIFERNDKTLKKPLESIKRYNILSETENIKCNGLNFIQKWYWNSKKSQVEIYLVATGIQASFYDEDKIYKYDAPVFYRRND
jgi:hypothetical protein